MARNGTGTYRLPEDAFVFDTVISQVEVNSNFSDIATEITNSIDKDGQTPISGILQHSVTVGQTANTGSVQGNNPITTEFYEIATCANAGDSCTLPAAKAGQLVIIVNNGANSADVFPASGDKIDGDLPMPPSHSRQGQTHYSFVRMQRTGTLWVVAFLRQARPPRSQIKRLTWMRTPLPEHSQNLTPRYRANRLLLWADPKRWFRKH